MSNWTLIINTVALWVIIVCQILESKQFSRTRKDFGELIKRNAELGLTIKKFEIRIHDLETADADQSLNRKALADAIENINDMKYELQRIDKTASNNREKIMALQEKNKDQQKYNADFAKAIRRVGKK